MYKKLLVLLAVVFISFVLIFTKLSKAPSLIIATYRLFFTTLILLPFVLNKNINELKKITMKTFLICMMSGIFLALHFATWISSIKYTSITSSTVLVHTHPIFIVIGSYFLFKEKISKKALLSIIIALFGSFIISLSDSSLGSNVLYGDLLAILGGFSMAGYMIIGKIARQKLSVNIYTFLVYSICTVVLLLFDLLSSTPLYPYSKFDFLLFILMAIFCTLLGHSILSWALKYLNPTFTSTSVLGEPVFASIWSMFIFNKLPTLWQIIGGLITIFGISLYIRVNRKDEV